MPIQKEKTMLGNREIFCLFICWRNLLTLSILFCAGNWASYAGPPMHQALTEEENHIARFLSSNTDLSFQEAIDLQKERSGFSSLKNSTLNTDEIIDYFTIRGTLGAIIIDDFAHNQSTIRYFIDSGKNRYQVVSTCSKDRLPYNREIVVTGKKLKNFLVVNSSDIHALSHHERKQKSPLKLAIFLVKYLDSVEAPFTVEEAYNKNLGEHSASRSFYKEMSEGKLDITGNVYGWYTLNRNGPEEEDMFNETFAISDTTLAEYYHVDLLQYDCVITLLTSPRWLYDSAGISRLGRFPRQFGNMIHMLGNIWLMLGQKDINEYQNTDSTEWDYLQYLFCHEFGHGLGFWHANLYFLNGWREKGELYSDERGNCFDTMGGGMFVPDPPRHFSSYWRIITNWMDSTSILSIKESGTYAIHPIEYKYGIKTARVKSCSSDDYLYYLEYRRPLDDGGYLSHSPYDLQGLFINATPKLLGMPEKTFYEDEKGIPDYGDLFLIKANRVWGGSSEGCVTLNYPNVYDDMQNGIKIGPLISINDDSAVFKIEIIQPLVPKNPTLIYPRDLERYPVNLRTLWTAVDNADSYELQFSENNRFNFLIQIKDIKDNKIMLDDTTLPTGSLYGRVRAKNKIGFSNWSDVVRFMTGEKIATFPELVYPPDGSNLINIPLELTWNYSGSKTNSFSIQIAKDYFFNIIVLEDLVSANKYSTKILEPLTTYYWHVRPLLTSDCVAWSETFSFSTGTFKTAVHDVASTFPRRFYISQNFPNPFNATTKIKYELPSNSFVILTNCFSQNLDVFRFFSIGLRLLFYRDSSISSCQNFL